MASTAKVSPGVIVGPEAQVCGEAVVSGKTQIFGRAKISGKAKIHNAKICQSSQINGFDVIDSDYYCQTEDPEPPHPGELGKKTLLGVDSDQDGVRDDVEIWINDTYSNTPQENLELIRIIQKETARLLNEILKFKDVKSKVFQTTESFITLSECHMDAAGGAEAAYENAEALDIVFFDVSDRVLGKEESKKHLVGLRATDRKTTKKSCLLLLKKLKKKDN